MMEQDEQEVQQEIRLRASENGIILFRNNSGAFKNPKSGQWVRYGLGNDSKRVNEELKSADLIGITPVTITQQHVGMTLGLFTALEVKHRQWSGVPSGDHEGAQSNWLKLVNKYGGFGCFMWDERQIDFIVERFMK